MASVAALVMDVDGVLTDGTFVWSASGEESKSFSFEDVMGLSRARRAGLKLGLISGEDSPLVDRFAEKVGITHVSKGCKEKGIALRGFAASMGIALERIAFIGDDLVNDYQPAEAAGMRPVLLSSDSKTAEHGRLQIGRLSDLLPASN